MHLCGVESMCFSAASRRRIVSCGEKVSSRNLLMLRGDVMALQSISVDIIIDDDRRNAVLQFKNDENEWVGTADAASIEALIVKFGGARSQMLEPVPPNIPDGFHPLAAFNPRWYVLPDTENRFATIWLRHPGLGWQGFGFPRHEAGNISKWLRKVISIKSTRDTQSPAATSIGGDNFLITTEELGFYYYGHGETRIGPNPFEQIEFDSDRAAGVVAGSVTERRLARIMHHACVFLRVRRTDARRRSVRRDRCEDTRCATRSGLICHVGGSAGHTAPPPMGRTA